MPLPREQAWFPAKRYGYGWGFPCRWQGWIAMLLYLVGTITAAVTLAETHWPGFFVCMVVLTVLFLGVCYLKGERPRWRWGKGGE